MRILYVYSRGKNLYFLADRKLKDGTSLQLSKNISFAVEKREGGFYRLKPSFACSRIIKILRQYGEPPIPPYMKNTPLKGKKLEAEYQTVFAKTDGSIAAPTAALHFTPRLLRDLAKKGIKAEFITLHVGLGTFAPVSREQLKGGILHEEWFKISRRTAAAVKKAKKERRPVAAVGTTVVRALESWGAAGRLEGKTDLFIREGYDFKIVDQLITNFHVPRSSLLMLVSAFAGRMAVLNIYRKAIRKGYRLFSFGDAMYIR